MNNKKSIYVAHGKYLFAGLMHVHNASESRCDDALVVEQNQLRIESRRVVTRRL